MNDWDLHEFIIRELSRHKNPNDIIRDVCDRTGLKWDVAEMRVKQVAVTERDKIVSKRKPVMLTIAIVTILIGVLTMIGVGWATLNGTMAFYIALPIPFLPNIVFFAIGFFMTLGGTMGLINLLKRE